MCSRCVLLPTRQPPDPMINLQDDLEQAYRHLQLLYNRFDQVSDQDLIEACCLELKAAEIRYNWLIKQVKAVWEEKRGKGDVGD